MGMELAIQERLTVSPIRRGIAGDSGCSVMMTGATWGGIKGEMMRAESIPQCPVEQEMKK